MNTGNTKDEVIQLLGSKKQRVWPVTSEQFWSNVPWVHNHDIPDARVPSPPHFPDPGSDEDNLIRYFYAWYRSYLSSQFCVTKPDRIVPKRRKHYKSMLRACQFLQKKRVTPVRWIIHCNKAWGYINDSYAPLTYMLAPRGCEKLYRVLDRTPEPGNTIVTVPKLVELVQLQTDMMQRLMLERPTSANEIKRIVSQFFPGKKHDRLVATARAQAEHVINMYSNRLSNFEWIW